MSMFPSTGSFPPPREFQSRAHAALRAGVKAGHLRQILMAPTGAGKTYIGLHLAYECLRKGKRVAFLADRLALIDQTVAKAFEYGLGDYVGVIQAKHSLEDWSKPFQIASVQSLSTWPADLSLIIIDEAHTQYEVWTSRLATTDTVAIGLSATPFAPGLGKLFTNLVNAASMRELTEIGVLVPMKVLSCSAPNMEGAATSGGEWTLEAAGERGMEILGDVVAEWLAHGENRKTICFSPTIAHCDELCRRFAEAGVMAATFTKDTTPTERAVLLDEYRKPNSQIRILISVEALAKGFDVPDVSCVIDCRPMRKSLSTAIQMWGRGLRASPETGKQDCKLLDHSGNVIRFASDFENIFAFGLDALHDGEKLDKDIRRDQPDASDKKGCPSCGFKPFRKRCMSCGFEIIQQADIIQMPGVMREVMIGNSKAAEDARHLWNQVCSYARFKSTPEKQHGRAANLYREIMGSWPPPGWRAEKAPVVEITSAVDRKIKSLNIAFARGRQRAA